MLKKIISIILAVLMISAISTVAFAEESDYATVIINGTSHRVSVGSKFTVEKSVILPADYAVQGGRFILYYDSDVVQPQLNDRHKYATSDCETVSVSGLTYDGGVSAAFAFASWSYDNMLTEGRSNFATFTFEVVGTGTTTFTEQFDLGVFYKSDPYKVIDLIKDGKPVAANAAIANATKTSTIFKAI